MTSRAKPSQRVNWRWPAERVQPCGTDGAYERHIYHGEVADPECLAAHAEAARHREQARKEARGVSCGHER